MKYRRAYVRALEPMHMQGELVSGAELENGDSLRRYAAIIVVNRGDPGQKEIGLSPAAEAAVARHVAAGGRVLCTYGCAPPKAIMPGHFAGAGRGPDWVVADNSHPLTEGLAFGQIVRYQAYRYRVSAIQPPSRVLIRELGGGPALTIARHGKGELIQTCGDLGATAGWGGTTTELLYRVLAYLVHGKVQARFGPTLPPPPRPVPRRDELRTGRELALPVQDDSDHVLRQSFTKACEANDLAGYEVQLCRDQNGQAHWEVAPPRGATVFAPWLRLPLGSASVEQGGTYRLSLRMQMAGVHARLLAPVRAELRFFDGDGVELSHRHIATPAAQAEPDWQTLRVQDVAPDRAVRAEVALSAMLPAGRLRLDELQLMPAVDCEEVFESEEPLASQIDGRPRVLLDPDGRRELMKLVQDRQDRNWGASPNSIFEAIRKRADRYLDETEIRYGKSSLPWPPDTLPAERGGLRWNPVAGAVGDRLKSLSLVYAVTGDERYGKRAAELLVALCRWPQWHDPANNHLGLEIGNIAIGVAFAHDLVHSLLSEGERTLVQEGIRRNALLPLYSKLSEGMGGTNGYALWATAMGLCGLATLGDVSGAASCVRLSEDCLLSYWDARWNRHRSEGQGYDSWAYGLLAALADGLRRNFGVDHFDHPFLPVMTRFAVYFLAGDRDQCAWFSDAGGAINYVAWHFPLTLLGARRRDGLAGWYLHETRSLALPRWDHFKLLALDPGMPISPPSPDEPGAVFPRVGWAALRSGWERDGTLIAFQCSSSAQGHCHRDQNNVLIYRGRENLAMDCGYASALGGALREFARGTVGHNSMLVDGKGQIAKRGSIPFFATSREVDYAMGDASAAYSASLLSRFHRHLIYVKPDVLVMIDDLRAARQARTFQWLLHSHSWGDEASVTCNGEALEVGGAAARGPIRIARGDERLRISFLHPPGISPRYVVYPGAEKYRPYIQAETPRGKSVAVVALLNLGAAPVAAAAAEVTKGRVNVTWRAGGHGYQMGLTLVGPQAGGPRLKIQRDGQTVIDERDLSVPLNLPG